MSNRLVCAPDVVWRSRADGGAFVVDTRSGSFLVLNATACEFVSHVRAGLDPAAITDRFARKYGLAIDVLRADLDALARELIDQKILEEGAI